MRFTVTATMLVLGAGCGGHSSGSDADAGGATSGADDAGSAVPIVLAGNQVRPFSIAIDNDSVYWVNAAMAGGVYKTPKSGGTPVALYEGRMGYVESFALDAANVYFPEPDRIVAVPLTGGAPRTLVTVANVLAVAVSHGFLYWVNPMDPAMPSAAASLHKVPVGGGEETSIALPSPPGVIEGASYLATDSDAVFAGLNAGGLVRIPFDNSAPTELVAGAPISSIAYDATTVFFASSGMIEAVPKLGGATIGVAAATNPTSVAVDGDTLYFVEDSSDGRVSRTNAASRKNPVVLAAHQAAPRSLVVDGSSIYWTCGDDGTVKKLAK